MALRPCLECGTPTNTSRCPTHTHPPPTYQETQRRAQTVATHKATHGNWCPGHNTPPHPTNDLTADHTTPRSKGGENGPLTTLCRQCNSRRRADDR